MPTVESLKEKITTLSNELNRLRSQHGRTTNRIVGIEQAITKARAELAQKQEPMVTDHAIIRYLERKYLIDMERIRSEILTPSVEAAIKAGATSIQIDGMTFPVRNNKITTALD